LRIVGVAPRSPVARINHRANQEQIFKFRDKHSLLGASPTYDDLRIPGDAGH